MLTATDHLRHLIDCSTLSEGRRACLHRLVRRLTPMEAEAMDALMCEIDDAWINPGTGEAWQPSDHVI